MLKTYLTFFRKNAFTITLMSAALYGVTLIFQAVKLKIWNTDLGVINSTGTQFLAIIIINLLYCSSMAILQEYIRKRSVEFVPVFIIFKYMHKLIRRLIKLTNRQYRQLKKKLKKSNTYPQNNDLFDLEKTSIDYKKHLIDTRKNLYKDTWYMIKTLFSYFLLGSILYMPAFFLFYTIALNINLGLTIVFYLLSILSILVISYHSAGQKTKVLIRNYNKKIKANNPESYIDICKKISEHGSTHVNKYIKQKQKDDTSYYKASIISALLMLFINLFLQIFPTQKDFWIYTNESGDNYAVIFKTDNVIVAKKADIEEGKITLHLNDQLYLTSSSIQTKYIKFDTAIINE